MYSFYNGEVPKHFDNYYSDIAAVHKLYTSWRVYPGCPKSKAHTQSS